MHRTIGQILADENIGLPLTAWEVGRLRRHRRRHEAATRMRAVANSGRMAAAVAR